MDQYDFFLRKITATGTIWLDDVTCVGTERRLEMCLHNGWGIENCGHAEDVGLRCVNETRGIKHVLCVLAFFTFLNIFSNKSPLSS